MAHISCPTALVNAPLHIVWKLFTEPAGWTEFFDIRVMRVDPPGSAIVGQRVYGESGPGFMHFRVTIDYTEIDQTRGKIGMIVKLPLGITVREDLSCSAVGYNQCRVNYRCDFDLPTGGRGAIVRLLLRRELNFGPADSLTRLKRAAELQVCGVNLLL